MTKNHCDLCGEGFDYPMKKIAFELPSGMIDTGWACELCAMEFDADAQPFDGCYNSTKSGHPEPATFSAVGFVPLFWDEAQHGYTGGAE